MHLFVDAVSRVRETCRQSLPKIISSLGADFAFSTILSRLATQYDETNNYLLQFNILYTYEIVIRAIPKDERVAPMFATLLKEMSVGIGTGGQV